MKEGIAVRILLVEDDLELCRMMGFWLEQNSCPADICQDSEEAFYYLKRQVYDVVILDRMLPGMDGIMILKSMRKQGITTPVIMVTAMGTLEDRVGGLDAGADDYLVKPFAPEELFARIRALERRPVQMELNRELVYGDVVLNLSNRNLQKGERVVELSKKEMDLLEFFIRNKGQTLTRDLLLNRVWGMDSEVEDGNLDNYIYFLRRRLKQVGSQVNIKTVRSVGYFLEE